MNENDGEPSFKSEKDEITSLPCDLSTPSTIISIAGVSAQPWSGEESELLLQLANTLPHWPGGDRRFEELAPYFPGRRLVNSGQAWSRLISFEEFEAIRQEPLEVKIESTSTVTDRNITPDPVVAVDCGTQISFQTYSKFKVQMPPPKPILWYQAESPPKSPLKPTSSSRP